MQANMDKQTDMDTNVVMNSDIHTDKNADMASRHC
jgi:hypothetical protein